MNIYNFYNVYGAMVKRAADDDKDKQTKQQGSTPASTPVEAQPEPGLGESWMGNHDAIASSGAEIVPTKDGGQTAVFPQAGKPMSGSWGHLLNMLRKNPGMYFKNYNAVDAGIGTGTALATAVLAPQRMGKMKRLLLSLLMGGGGAVASNAIRTLYNTRNLEGSLPTRIGKGLTGNMF